MEVYFWIFASVIVLSALGRLYLFIKGGNRVQIYELFESLIAILGTLGLYGYVYSLNFGSKLFWKVIFIFLLLSFLYSLFKPKSISAYKKLGNRKAVLLIGATALFSLPATYMLGLYAYSS